MDFEAERRAQASDGLPVVLLALYEKYTCLRFAELTRMNKGKIKELKELMLNLQRRTDVLTAAMPLLCSYRGAQLIRNRAVRFLCKHKSNPLIPDG